MEIKVHCACGAKYKFESEPVNRRMPFRVNCPQCNADGTAQANDIIAQTLGTARTTGPQPVVAPPAEIAPPPVGATTVSPSPPPGIATAGGLRFSGPTVTPLPNPEPVSDDFAPPPPPVRMVARRVQSADAGPGSGNKLVGAFSVVVVLAALTLGVWKFGGKWYERLAAVSEVAQVLGEASGADSSAEDRKNNFWFEDATVLFIRHTNHGEVARACVEYWKEQLHQPLLILRDAPEEFGTGQYELWPEHNGWVRLFGGLDWPQLQYEGLAQHLSQKYNTLVFEARDVDFTGAYHFGVYEQGARKFHAQMDVKIKSDNLEEIVTTEGDDWARAHGYKPGPEGFKEFHLGEADKIAQRLGLKTWDENPEEQRAGLWLREPRAIRSN